MHEGNKHSELIIPKNFTFSYRHERGTDATAKAPCFVHTDASEAQVCVKAESMSLEWLWSLPVGIFDIYI